MESAVHRRLLTAIAVSAFSWGLIPRCVLADELPPPAEKKVDFASDIQPLFEKYCLKCHGEEKQQAGFRLDREGDALRGGDTGAAFEAGKSADSLMIRYMAGVDPDVTMPPEGEKLSDDEIGLIRAWIDQGATWGEAPRDKSKGAGSTHWSFQPVRRPSEPQVTHEGWVRNAIDRFVLARLEAEQIEPSPEADRRTLMRRLSFDLLGLPPRPEDVEEFARDSRHDAWERLVDRLLDSPHFGERWGRHWLDLARYADSDGYEKDSPRPHAWRYRHWVIDALNRDLPFDQFTIEQLAGDLIPGAGLEQKIATGFHRNTLTNREGGVDQEEFRVAAVVDRVNTTSSVWLGLTLGCAQCHTHKYDPLTLREYYGMFAFFNQGDEVDLPAPLADEVAAYDAAKAEHDRAHQPFTDAVADFVQNKLPARQKEWERKLDPNQIVRWQTIVPESIRSAENVKFAQQGDGSFLVSGENPETATYTIKARSDLSGVTAFRIEALADESLGGKGPGRTPHGNFVLSEVRITTQRGDEQELPVKLQKAVSRFSQNGFVPASAIDGDPKTGWAVASQFGRNHIIQFETSEDVGGPGTDWTIVLDQHHGSQHTLGRFRITATTQQRPVDLEGIPDDVQTILALDAANRSAEQLARVTAYYRTIDPDLVKLVRAEAEHGKKAPKPPRTLAQTIADRANPRKTHIHMRGDFLRPGDEVSPHVPAVLSQLGPVEGRAANRLDLARWLVSPANTLTPRVTANRIWKNLFGQALVASMEDFGTRGEKPSHPELLDWLASEFVNPMRSDVNGKRPVPWSVKGLIREIVTSSTYRQSSKPRAELIDRDPKNTFLARQNRYRLEAEIIRDAYLAASGLLATKVGGPSVRPKQPAGISDLTYAGSAKWVESTGEDRYRRGIYTWFQRTSPYPMLMTFDAPDSNVTCARRERSNTPLQALTLLNDPVFHECAQALARRIRTVNPGDLPAQWKLGFELCVARPPTVPELSRLEALYAELKREASTDSAAAAQLAGEPAPPPAELVEVAATVALARILLNLDEFVARE